MTQNSSSKININIAHSPDSDDAFMFYALKEKKIDVENFNFSFAAAEIAQLNQKALEGQNEFEIIAVSFATLFDIEDEYELMPSGTSFAGKDYGPKIICADKDFAKLSDSKANLNNFTLAVPGKNTSAFLATKAFLKENYHSQFQYIFCAYDEVFDLIDANKANAALLIHEAQLKYQDYGFKLLVDLGVWWHTKTVGLNMPLGCNAIKKSLGKDNIKKLNKLLKDSILWGKENFEEVKEYSRTFAQNNLDDFNAKKYLDMYVNETTIELKAKDYKSIELLKKLY